MFTLRAQATTCSKHHTRTVMDAGWECAPRVRSANPSDSLFFMFNTTVLPFQFLSFHFLLNHYFQFFLVYVLDWAGSLPAKRASYRIFVERSRGRWLRRLQRRLPTSLTRLSVQWTAKLWRPVVTLSRRTWSCLTDQPPESLWYDLALYYS